jgi:hypothetical protein
VKLLVCPKCGKKDVRLVRRAGANGGDVTCR